MTRFRHSVLPLAALYLAGMLTPVEPKFCLEYSWSEPSWCQETTTPQQKIQKALDYYKSNPLRFVSDIEFKPLKLPDMEVKDIKNNYTISKFAIDNHFKVKELKMISTDPEDISIAISMEWKKLSLKMLIDGTVSQTAVKSRPKIVVKGATAYLTGTWKIQKDDGKLSIGPYEVMFTFKDKGTKVKVTKGNTGSSIKEVARKVWDTYKTGIRKWLGWGIKKGFDAHFGPELSETLKKNLI